MHVHQGDQISSESELDEEITLVTCAVLRLEYTAETFDIAIPLPATEDEVVNAMQLVRSRDSAAHFPRLISVLPQPSLGVAAFIAHPSCTGGADLICVDATAVDGRIFVAQSPAYASKSELVAIAGLPAGVDFTVLCSVEQVPVTEQPVHLFPGALVTFQYPGQDAPRKHTIGEVLQQREMWGRQADLPRVAFSEARCLVHKGPARLCVDATRQPMRYRDNIAGVTGADPARMRLFAASPAPADVAVLGVPCCAVIAVCHPPPGARWQNWHCALLDCRLLRDYVPRGCALRLDGKPEGPGVLWIAPGQIIVASLVSSAEPAFAEEHTAHGDTAPSDPVDADWESGYAPHTATGQDGTGGTITTTTEELGQPMPASARDPQRRQWFPRLIPASQQTKPGYAILLALPPWDGPGVGIVIDNAVDPRGIFAILAPPRPQRHHFLVLAGLAQRQNVHVYVRDMPWPLAEGNELTVDHGDTISIQPTHHAVAVITTLGDMLQDASNWHDGPVSTRIRSDNLLLLHDRGSCLFLYDRERRHLLRHDFASLLHVPDFDLRIRPSRPGIADLNVKGTWVNTAIIATSLAIRLDAGGTGLFPYVIDARPIMLGIDWAANAEGVLNLRLVAQRFSHRTWDASGLAERQSRDQANALDTPSDGGYPSARTDRPIATPCRGNNSGQSACPSAAVVEDPVILTADESQFQGNITFAADYAPASWLGPTLLEQSVRQADNAAFALARTLLEAIIEHRQARETAHTGHSTDELAPVTSLPVQPEPEQLGGANPQQCAIRPSTGRTISLAALLPSCVAIDLSQQTLNIGKSLDDILPILTTPWVLAAPLPQSIVLHDSTVDAFTRHIEPPAEGILPVAFEIYTDGSYQLSLSSWAFVVIARWEAGTSFCGYASGTVALQGDPMYLGATAHSAVNGEKTALFWATAWALKKPWQVPCRIYSDSTVAQNQTGGGFSTNPEDVLGNACRSIAQAAESLAQLYHGSFEHVKAHAGNPYNELADVLAKARLTEASAPPAIAVLASWACDGDIAWLWLLIEAVLRPALWPQFQRTCLSDAGSRNVANVHDLYRCIAPLQNVPAKASPPALQTFRFQPRVITVNVQTLAEDQAAGVLGRVPYIREQLRAVKASVIGLQETRAKQSETISSATHIRYLSQKDASGAHGVEVWFATDVPYAWAGSTPIFFRQADIRVLSADPRSIMTRVARGNLRFLVIVIHAPTAQDPGRDLWWKQLRERVVRVARGDPAMLQLLQDIDNWVPATYEGIHTGESYTWVAPGSGAASRIDFITIPAAWSVSADGSSVLYHVDFGQTGLDHYGVMLDVDTCLHVGMPRTAHGPKIDRVKLQSPDSQGVLDQICAGVPEVPWAVDANEHYATVAAYLQDSLAVAFPAPRTRCRRPFFSPTTWDLRQRRLDLRRRLQRACGHLRTATIRAAFASWTQPVRPGQVLAKSLAALIRCVRHAGQDIAELRQLQPTLRRSIQHDRKVHLRAVANEAMKSSTKDTVSKLRPLLGPPKRLCRGTQALPTIRLEDGSVAADKGEADRRWLRHFSAIENGEPVEVHQYIQDCLSRQSRADLDPLSLVKSDLPTRIELETSMRAMQCGKATGNDGVVPDLLHLKAAGLSRTLYQIFLKVAYRIQEPVAWKGGTLHSIWKGRGSQAECENYRAILVSSSVGKAVHGMFRTRCSEYLEVACTPMQIGGRRGQPVQIATHAIRAFQKACVDRRLSCAVLFVDLREAFHRVVRPLIHGGNLSDEHLAGVVREIGLPPASLHRLYAYAREQSLLCKAGASAWTARMLQEFNEDSWVTYGGGPDLAVVRAGTRPGDNLADMTFTFLFAEILNRIRDTFAAQDLAVRIPWNQDWLCRPSATAEAGITSCSPVDATWMDDLSIVLQARTASQLLSNLRAATRITLEECLQAALLPNLRAGKTETVVSLFGHGANKLAKEHFGGRDPSLNLESELWPGARLRLAASYKHLGGIIHAKGGLAKEVKARLGFAWKAFTKHRKLVFGSPIIGIGDKSCLFTSLVESTLYYGCGTWSGVQPALLARLQSNVVNMARCIVSAGKPSEEVCHLSPGCILAAARIASVSTSLHVERLRHFKATVLKATNELWAILHYEGEWLQEVQASLLWLTERHRRIVPTSHPWEGWDNAISFIRQQPEAWKRAVNKAKQVAILEELWTAEVQRHQGLAFRAYLRAGAAVSSAISQRDDQHEICAICGTVFDDLKAWSHHAFKRHGRVNPVRRLATGSQCAVCLAQFRANKGLCNHLAYSTACRHALLNSGFRCEPEPGTGHRKFDSGHNVLVPATQAQGPRGRWDFTPVVDELHQPSDPLLRDLEACFCHDADKFGSWTELVGHVRGVFRGQCLQVSRLQATAQQWHSQLQVALSSDEEWPVQWAVWHQRLARLLCDVNFVEWLGEGACTPELLTATFRDAATLLPWLEFDGLHILSQSTPDEVYCYCVPEWTSLPSEMPHHSRRTNELNFEGWVQDTDRSGFVCLYGLGFEVDFSAPSPLSSYHCLEGPLSRLRTFSDLIRGLFYLWTKEVPTCIFLPPISCPAVEVIRKIAPFRAQVLDGDLLANFSPDGCF
ncbi:unnamed protein product [Symbiodinium sp. CCMP2592]|nr:unnamed protein product [Symbiodinium sp. CCMP2592]